MSVSVEVVDAGMGQVALYGIEIKNYVTMSNQAWLAACWDYRKKTYQVEGKPYETNAVSLSDIKQIVHGSATFLGRNIGGRPWGKATISTTRQGFDCFFGT